MEPRTCSDLAGAIAELAAMAGFEHLTRRLDQISALSACCSDLRFARDCIAALDELLASPRGLNRPARQTTESALMMTAVNFYARATAITAKRGARGGSRVDNQLSADERHDHDAIVEVRHRGLTHITPNSALAGGEIWSIQRPLAFDTGEGWKVAVATRNIGLRVALLDQLRRQISVAERILSDRFQGRIESLGDEIKKAPEWDRILREHAIDPAEVFGSSEATAKAMAPLSSSETMTTFFALEP
jgi:hypothetical protein